MFCALPPVPAIYSHGPAKAHITYHSVADMSLMCPAPWGLPSIGCSIYAGGSWDVWLPRQDEEGCTVDQIRQHELAHVRGWPKDHPE